MIISQNSNDVYYAYTRGRFWRWDESAHVWRESHLLAQKFSKAKTVEKRLTPEAFLTSDEFIPMDDYELPERMLTALRDAKPCKNAPIEPVEEAEVPCKCSTCTCSGCKEECFGNCHHCGHPVEDCNSYQTGGEKHLASVPQDKPAAPTFDFGADEQTNTLLLQDAQTFITGNMARIMAAKHAHDLTANHYQGSWGKWCAAVGISRDTGDRMVSVAAQCGNIQLEGKSILDVQPLKLLYAAAKPSTPEVVKQAVFTGDITTYKEYQELMAQFKAEKERADKAEAERDKARADQISTAKDCNRLGLKASQEKDRADKAEARAKNAEGQLSGSRQVAEAAKLRADKLQEENAALKKQPIAAVVDEEEVERRANQRAHDIAEDLAAEMTADLQARLEQASSGSEQDARDAYDSIILAGRSITSIVQSAKMQFRKLPDDQRETAINQFVHTLASAQGEVSACL